MKIIVILLMCSLACLVMSDSEAITEEQVREITNKCKEESKATDEDVAAMMKKEPATGPAAKCMKACVMKKLEILNEEGKLVKEAALTLGKLMAEGDEEKEALIAEAIDACLSIEVPEDHCEAAEDYSACLMKAGHEKASKE